MTIHSATIAVMVLSALTSDMASAQLAPRCVENSPERRGEVGCSIVARRALPGGLKEPLYWHIDRFESSERAQSAVGQGSVAFEAAGTSWLMTMNQKPLTITAVIMLHG